MQFLKVRKYQILLILTPVVIILDQITKLIILDKFRLHESIPVIEGFFNFTFIRNTGAAFGILAEADPRFRIPFFMIIPLVALGVITMVFRRLPQDSKLVSTALALVIGGAIGNLIDRIAYGSVIDFLDFHWKSAYHFPAFNIADSAICVGVGILMLDMFINDEHSATKPSDSKDVDASGTI